MDITECIQEVLDLHVELGNSTLNGLQIIRDYHRDAANKRTLNPFKRVSQGTHRARQARAEAIMRAVQLPRGSKTRDRLRNVASQHNPKKQKLKGQAPSAVFSGRPLTPNV